MDWSAVEKTISQATGESFHTRDRMSLGGGCINAAYRLKGDGRSYFVKVNDAHLRHMFDAEFAGLQELDAAQAIRIPRPVVVGESGGQAWLVLENMELGHGGDSRLAGEQLAQLHCQQARQFGWSMDNTIGSTRQINRQEPEWSGFWREHRLGFQLQLAERNGFGGRLQQQGGKLLESFHQLLDHDPAPSLLHGDLWGGNIGYLRSGAPVIFDPAVYYGDREADIAMTELFGGFGADFYAAYNAVWSLDPGYAVRKTLYNLYHILNHANMFGGGYAGQAQGMIDRLLAEIG
ncbi:MAG: fructosamine kinase family protein [Pseudomonadota bacterium]